jgi:hypothetical protein
MVSEVLHKEIRNETDADASSQMDLDEDDEEDNDKLIKYLLDWLNTF